MKYTLGLLALSLVAAATASAQVLPGIYANDLASKLGGSSYQMDLWYSLSGSRYPNMGWANAKPGTGWLKAESQVSDEGTIVGPAAQLAKLGNAGSDAGFYFATNSIYSWTVGSTLAVEAQTPLLDDALVYQTRTVILQMVIGEAYGDTFIGDDLPQLTIKHADGTSVVDLKTGFFRIIDDERVGEPFIPEGATEEVYQYNNLWAFQWDTRGYTDISSISISFGLVPHTQLYEIQLDRSNQAFDNFVFVVPEPGTYALIIGGAALGLIALRRRSR